MCKNIIVACVRVADVWSEYSGGSRVRSPCRGMLVAMRRAFVKGSNGGDGQSPGVGSA